MLTILKLMRPHHYIKNLLVFAALVCSGNFFIVSKLLDTCCAFLAFCMTSSVVYIINDIRDKEKDSQHPTKCKRPIACGSVSIRTAWILVAVLVIVASLSNMLIYSPLSSLLLLLYFLANLGYSFGLKNIPLVDIAILVSGFLIRVAYGSLITNIAISNWLYLTVISASFYFALGKRRNELKRLGTDTRIVLKTYSLSFLDKNMYMCLTLTNVFYSLWSMDNQTVTSYNNAKLIFTVPIVLLITMKYSMLIEGDSDGDPVEVLFHDKKLLILCTLYALMMFLILYM